MFTMTASGSGASLPNVDLQISRATAERLVDALQSALRRDGEPQVRFAASHGANETTAVLDITIAG
ncbi:MAG TPA: hypothetical protein VK906_10470 [Egicoccus sp.]|nr:hypothetical protein [Egicoccus sp.]HSK23592.1 hypothetical protein [Egicoccus sp.]